ncbi:PLD nuclease N-terminal domain-containing protein [Microbacterium sp. A84]|uniref:PLD nuclease N-terminal domain-containing protein n=1 Tax=Microbacterium sp. A84 TaxID=3450715 RepID=UPI003F42B771
MPFLSILVVALMIVALIDVITRDNAQVKRLPKMVWIILVIFLPLIGSILWFALGREYSGGGIPMPRMPRRAAQTRVQTRTQTPANSRWAPPADSRNTEQQIADLDREIEEWRLRQEIEKRKQEGGDATQA